MEVLIDNWTLIPTGPGNAFTVIGDVDDEGDPIITETTKIVSIIGAVLTTLDKRYILGKWVPPSEYLNCPE